MDAVASTPDSLVCLSSGVFPSPERAELGKPSELSDLSIDALEDEIGLLSSHLNAATYRLLLLIAELDRREPWATFGCKTCAHYLNWKCGLALSAAREKVRTARALGALPLISKAFGSGRISYSKARALTRVANEQNEQSLLDIALAGTATHVERVVRHYRQMQATDSPEEIFNRRSFSCYWDDDGSLVFRGRLTAEQGALLMQAIEQARMRPDDHNSLDDYETNGADAVVSICADYLAGSDRAEDASKGSRTADRFQVKVTAPVSSLLPANANTDADADENADAEANSKPEIDQHSVPGALPVLDDGPALSIQTLRRLCCDGTILPIVEDTNGNPLRVGRKTRTVSGALRRAVDRRDGGCRFPGCTQTRHVDAHHIIHWADGGPTNLDNLISLCRKHHTWVHEANFKVDVSAEGLIEFRNRYGVKLKSNEQRRFSGGVMALIEQNQTLGLDITAKTSEPSWDGKRVDYDHIMRVLGQQLPISSST
ncbi:MAG: DUF222 domain-containing protein [Burkholderiaceae bacterium]